jgi:hypothetical protein
MKNDENGMKRKPACCLEGIWGYGLSESTAKVEGLCGCVTQLEMLFGVGTEQAKHLTEGDSQ